MYRTALTGLGSDSKVLFSFSSADGLFVMKAP